MKKNEIFLCSICNTLSGSCAEDCGYCTQSAKFGADIKRWNYKSVDVVLNEARAAAKAGALGFCLVSSGRNLDEKRLEYICRCARAIIADGLHLHLIGCNGIASREALAELKNAGIASYNHNLETAQSHFSKICTTHSYEERYKTNENAASVGLGICCGGIFGLGESWEQRHEFLRAIASLKPHTSPINFFMRNPALPINAPQIEKEEALECIKLAKQYLPNARLMAAGGREMVFGSNQREIFELGINAVVLGDYLTTSGNEPNAEVKMLKDYGLEIATNCE